MTTPQNVLLRIPIGGFVNVYLFRSQAGLCLIDAGTPFATLGAVEKALRGWGHSWADVAHILITHAHFDHVGALAKIQAKAPQARTYAHANEGPIIRGEKAMEVAARSGLRGADWLSSFMLAKQLPPAKVDQELREGDTPVPELEAVELFGHSRGQVGYWWREAGALMGGDVLMNSPRLTAPLRAASPDWPAAKRSIEKVQGMNLEALHLGHGPSLKPPGAAALQAVLDRWQA